MSDLFLLATIARHRAPDSPDAPPYRIRRQLLPLLQRWAGPHLESVTVSGSYAKGTALRDPGLFPAGIDVDLFLSLSPSMPSPLASLHASLLDAFHLHSPRLANVSVRILWNGSTVDLVPARRLDASRDHTLWQARRSTPLRTNIDTQIRFIRSSALLDEILALKIWRRRHALYFPGYYLELAAIRALSPITQSPNHSITKSFLSLLHFLATSFPAARITDPANSSNIVSDLLTPSERFRISETAAHSLSASTWPEIL